MSKLNEWEVTETYKEWKERLGQKKKTLDKALEAVKEVRDDGKTKFGIGGLIELTEGFCIIASNETKCHLCITEVVSLIKKLTQIFPGESVPEEDDFDKTKMT